MLPINSMLKKALVVAVSTGAFAASSQAALSCCSLAPASFKNTLGWAGELTRVQNKTTQLVHLIGYKNSAKNLAPGANAMLLPIPAKAGTLTKNNMLDASKVRTYLNDMAAAVHTEKSKGSREAVRQLSAPVQVFEHGIYTVVLAQRASDIGPALSQVPQGKRPSINQEIFDAYDKWYPGWTFALCCFNNKDSKDSEPLTWWYEPLDPNHLFFPALDAHSGKKPILDAKVEVDHVVAVSSDKMIANKGATVVYAKEEHEPMVVGSAPISIGPSVQGTEKILKENWFLPRRVIGSELRGDMPQGDFVFEISEVRSGQFRPWRRLPPGVKNWMTPQPVAK